MINQQLLDFIKQQLVKGLTREKITSDLLANGWTMQDVQEGFNALTPPTTPTPSTPIPLTNTFFPSSYNNINSTIAPVQTKTHSGRKIFFITLILFLLAGGASAYYFKDNLANLPILKNLLQKKEIISILPSSSSSAIGNTYSATIGADNTALINFLKDNNLQAIVVQQVDQSNKSTVSLVKSDGTITELFNWIDGGTHDCQPAFLSDCSDRAPIRTKFLDSSVPVNVYPSLYKDEYSSLNSVHYFDYNTTRNSSSVDLAQYFPNDQNTIHLQGYSDNFSPNGKFVFHEPVMGTPYSYSVTRKYYMVLEKIINNDYVNVANMPNIINLGMAWTPDSRYLIYEYQDPVNPVDRNVDKNADAKVNVYDTSTNTKTELINSFPINTIVGALSNNKFVEVKADGTYLVSVNNGVVLESKLFSPETKLVGLIP